MFVYPNAMRKGYTSMSLTDRIWAQIVKLVRYVWLSIWSIIELPFALLLEVLPPTRVAFWIKDHFPGFWNWLLSRQWVERAISKGVFRRFGGTTPPRPHRSTMADAYTSWKAITDLSYTGRHLPEDPNFDEASLPAKAKLVDLFVREEDGTEGGKMDADMRSTLLFASFAQWFTDSFLRTSHAFKFDANGNVITKNGLPERELGREKRNDSTHEIDLCQIYGLNKEMTDALRCPTRKGCLRSEIINGEEYPERVLEDAPVDIDGPLPIKNHFKQLHDERVLRHIFRRTASPERYELLFATGLEHSNATIGNALLNTVFVRLHNKIANKIAGEEKGWDSDRVFETTRNTMIVILLQIVISDYVRHISPLDLPLSFQKGMAEEETWYRRNRIHIEFNILYRWHGLVPSSFDFLPSGSSADFRHNNKWLTDTGLSQAITTFSKVPAGKMIIGNTPRFLAPVKQDTVAIMRAAKLQSYNAYRVRFGLKPAKTFADVTRNKQLERTLSAAYGGDIDKLEWYIGMCSETHGRGMIMGDLMFQMVAHDAFTHALTNPLLAKEIFDNPTTFGDVGRQYVRDVKTLKQVVDLVVPGGTTVCEFAMDGVHTDKEKAAN